MSQEGFVLPEGAQSAAIELQVTRADGTREPSYVGTYYHRDPVRQRLVQELIAAGVKMARGEIERLPNADLALLLQANTTDEEDD